MNREDEVRTLRRLNALEQRSGQVYDQIACTYVPLTSAIKDGGGNLDGGALNVGTYTVGPLDSGADYTFDYPTTVKALYAYLAVRWAVASGGSYAYLRPNGSTVNEICIICNALIANVADLKNGIVNLDSSGLAQILVVGANAAAVNFYVQGYFV